MYQINFFSREILPRYNLQNLLFKKRSYIKKTINKKNPAHTQYILQKKIEICEINRTSYTHHALP